MLTNSNLSGPSLLPSSGVTKKLVILFHGYGADGNDLITLAEDWAQSLPDTEFIAPNAPFPCDENPFGRQWFSMRNWTIDKILNGLQEVAPIVEQYIASTLQKRQLTHQDLVLVGFSQGAMLSLYQAYYVIKTCAGVIAYSGAFFEETNTLPKNLPRTLLVHGDADQVVPVEGSIMANDVITQLGGNPQLLICPGLPHAIDPQGLIVGQEFLQNVLSYEKIKTRNNIG